ncbi:PD-(D/E)XK nuclease family protein [Flavobacterium sp.]|uniref:PDDEXK-like family protein n=1 Tax=Flavobacterium sp. TaxID=239 RepID=UPI0035B4DA4C
MSEIGLVNINNLLNQVSIIKKKYDDLAEYTGENYNVFNVLGIYNDELSHSKIIGDFLNVKGSHGQKDTFLKLFLNEINGFEENTEQLKVLHNFKTENSRTHIEKYIGKVEFSNGQGGRIDILIQEGTNNIIIENKVWAGDQYLQLVRYNNEDKNAPIIYLTLDGKEPSSDSKGDLILGKEFICISYKVEIVRWLENCIKEMANKPIIRESLNQYLVLVKQLTHQSTNNKMKEELINILIKNPENLNAAKIIAENYQNALIKINFNPINKLFLYLNELGIETNKKLIERANRGDGDGVFIPLKEFKLEDGEFELGINIELANNYYFFCVLQKNDIRKANVNTHPKFQKIKEFLHSRIENLNEVNGWTIGKSKDFIIGFNSKDFTEDDESNLKALKSLAIKINDFKNILNS